MLAGRFKISEEEKSRQKEVLDQFRRGTVVEFIKSDYHEDEETPRGFMVCGDIATLERVVGTRPIVESDTRKQVGSYKVWEIDTQRYGILIRDELYLAAMTKIKTNE
jgi:hypothetical protein